MTDTPPPDLGKLRIDRSAAPLRRRRMRRTIWLGVVAALVVAGVAVVALRPRAAAVETTPVVTTYPTQQ
jgi:hypothetical protein